RPQGRETGIERERAARPRARVAVETALDLGAVEELRRVARAEPEREPRVAQRLGAAAVARERPREHVVAVDRRPLPLRAPRERERRPPAQAVVDVEERRLEVGAHAVRDEQPPDALDGGVLLLRRALVTGHAEQV